MSDAELPLRYQTPPAWAAGVLARPLELLNDHAHLEKKAAANALELLNRWPEPQPAGELGGGDDRGGAGRGGAPGDGLPPARPRAAAG